MKIKHLIIVLIAGFLLCVVALLGFIVKLAHGLTYLNLAQEKRYASYMAADELRQNSEDLTKFSRLYVTTGEEKYRNMYNDILRIRNGSKARPEKYDQIYWDLMTTYGEAPTPDSTETRSLSKIMKEIGFTDQELSLLQTVITKSNEVNKIDTKAMALISEAKGKGVDFYTSEQRQQAIELLNNDTYMLTKTAVLKPLNIFLGIVNDRTTLQVSTLQKNGQTAFKQAFAFIIFIILVAIIISFVAITKISKPLEKFQKLFDKGTEGNLQVRSDITSNNEYGDLSTHFNTFFDKLSNVIQQMQNSVGQVTNIKNTIIASSSNTAEQLAQIKINTEKLSTNQEKLQKNVGENASFVEEIVANIQHVNKQIANQSNMIEQATVAITQMFNSLQTIESITHQKKESVDQLVQIIDAGNNNLNNMNASFKNEVINRIGAISSLTNTINSIASQTNLLSMNAAIEAAHAGDAGKGFAVVAEEIRKLADISSKSSANISKVVKEISEGVSATETKTIETSKVFSKISTQVMQTKEAFDQIESNTTELGAGSKQIMQSMQELQDVTITIKNASNEMEVGTHSMITSQEGLQQISNIVKEGVLDINKKTESIVKSSTQIENNSLQLDQVVTQLTKESTQFKL